MDREKGWAILLERAEAIAREAHSGQVDKGGAPYIEHIARVAAGVDHQSDRIVAWLHDVVEDTEWTREQLDAACNDLPDAYQVAWRSLVADVALLTKIEGQPNHVYYARVKMSPRAKRVKLSDVADNSDPERLAMLPSKTRERLTAKYAEAREALK